MTATIDVEDVLSKLNVAEKVSLLSGQLFLHPPLPHLLTDKTQALTGGIPMLSLNTASPQSVSPMVQTASEAPNSSMVSKQPASHVALR